MQADIILARISVLAYLYLQQMLFSIQGCGAHKGRIRRSKVNLFFLCISPMLDSDNGQPCKRINSCNIV